MPKSSISVLVAAFALAVAGAGCVASLGEMRAKPAQRVLVAPGRYGDLGGCVAAGLQEAPTAGFWGFLLKPGDLRLEVVRRDDQQTMTVTGYPGWRWTCRRSTSFSGRRASACASNSARARGDRRSSTARGPSSSAARTKRLPASMTTENTPTPRPGRPTCAVPAAPAGLRCAERPEPPRAQRGQDSGISRRLTTSDHRSDNKPRTLASRSVKAAGGELTHEAGNHAVGFRPRVSRGRGSGPASRGGGIPQPVHGRKRAEQRWRDHRGHDGGPYLPIAGRDQHRERVPAPPGHARRGGGGHRRSRARAAGPRARAEQSGHDHPGGIRLARSTRGAPGNHGHLAGGLRRAGYAGPAPSAAREPSPFRFTGRAWPSRRARRRAPMRTASCSTSTRPTAIGAPSSGSVGRPRRPGAIRTACR